MAFPPLPPPSFSFRPKYPAARHRLYRAQSRSKPNLLELCKAATHWPVAGAERSLAGTAHSAQPCQLPLNGGGYCWAHSSRGGSLQPAPNSVSGVGTMFICAPTHPCHHQPTALLAAAMRFLLAFPTSTRLTLALPWFWPSPLHTAPTNFTSEDPEVGTAPETTSTIPTSELRGSVVQDFGGGFRVQMPGIYLDVKRAGLDPRVHVALSRLRRRGQHLRRPTAPHSTI
eukprot:369384-Rhodomonas_salina.2